MHLKKDILPQNRNIDDLQACIDVQIWKSFNAGNLWEAFIEILSNSHVKHNDVKRPKKVDRVLPPAFQEQIDNRIARRQARANNGERISPVATRARVANGTGTLFH